MKKKLFSGILIGIVMLSLTFNFAIAFQKSNAINDINSYNNIEKLDDNNCLIHFGDVFSKKDLLMTKEANLNKFDYKIFDNNTKDEIYRLSTAQNIIFNDGKVSSIYNNCWVLYTICDCVKNKKDPITVIKESVGVTMTALLNWSKLEPAISKLTVLLERHSWDALAAFGAMSTAGLTGAEIAALAGIALGAL